MQETWVRSLGQEDPLEKEMATHSSILAWKVPWTEEPGGLQSTSHRVTKSQTGPTEGLGVHTNTQGALYIMGGIASPVWPPEKKIC